MAMGEEKQISTMKPRLSLADCLRSIRKECGMTLAELASRTGIPRTTLSKVENGKASLTYEKLVQVGDGLGVDIARLFDPQTHDQGAPHIINARRRAVTRLDEAASVDSDNYTNFYLSLDLLKRRANPIMSVVKAKTIEEFGEWVRHEGEEFAIVIEGEVEFSCEDYAPVVLKQGDSVYFDSAMGHAYLAASDSPCRILSVCIRD